jgi:hypothetical protein
MIEFLTPLDYRHLSGEEIMLVAPFAVDLHGELVLVPPGFISDGASIPRIAWRVVGHPFADYLESAILHDWLYSTEFFPREGCDSVFLQAMEAQEIAAWRRMAMWRAVRDWGWLTWRRHEPEQLLANLSLLSDYEAGINNPEQWASPLGPAWEASPWPEASVA